MSSSIIRILTIVAAVIVVTVLAACAGGAQGPAVTVEDTWARPSPVADGNSAIFMVLKNGGSEADTLIKVVGDVSNAIEIHETIMENEVMKMRPVEGQRLEVPAGKSVELKPGGLHIMLIGLKQPLNPGDKVDITLTFEKSGEKKIQAEVRPMEGMDQMGEMEGM